MSQFNKYVFIVCIAALASGCKSGGGGSANAESLSSEDQQKSSRVRTTNSTSYRISNNSRVSTSVPTPAPKVAPTPIVTSRPVPLPEPIAEILTTLWPWPWPEPKPEPRPEPQVVLGSANLSWTIPTKRQNGNNLSRSELGYYEVYYTSDSGKSDTIKVTDASRTSLTVNNLETDTYYFAMAAVDKDGIFSELSNEVPKTIN